MGFELADVSGVFVGDDAIPVDVEVMDGGENLGDGGGVWVGGWVKLLE